MQIADYLTQRYAFPRTLATETIASLGASANGDRTMDEWDREFIDLRLIGVREIGLFRRFTRDEVNELAVAWAWTKSILDRVEGDVGLHNRLGLSNYERMFGRYALMSGTGYETRADFVKQTIRTMRSQMAANRWLIEKNNDPNALASALGTNRYRLSLGRITNIAQVGFLIHELAHNAGMEDVCESCSKALFDKAQSRSRQVRHELYPANLRNAPPTCTSNASHGAMATGGHFLGWVRTSELARTSKQLSVWNADSYRWYCMLFFKEEANQAFQDTYGRVPTW